MTRRLRYLGIALVIIGIAFVAAGGFAFMRVQEGTASLQAFSKAQNVELTYNEEGQLVDRGEPATEIMALLTEDWGYPVVASELDPNDPVVNTASEYMFQMATIAYHTLHGSTTVVLPEDVEYNGEVFAAGEYEFQNDGRYWTQFDRNHPIEGAARGQIWSATAHALIAELGVGTVTAQALQLGLALVGLFVGLGATLLLTGSGLIWATRAEAVPAPVFRRAPEPIPA
ncbi:MAG TPA: hypothetical protein VFH63_07650 [candidate division Zixibacteria bacterium]|nr:hypothetical protein [candidate division Zixibacteria bacterium]